jgi:hypothetical protein
MKLLTKQQIKKYNFTFVNGIHLIDKKDICGFEDYITITDLITEQAIM